MIAMVNDEDRPRSGALRLTFTDATAKSPQRLKSHSPSHPSAQESYLLTLKTPAAPGSYSLQAIATPSDSAAHPTVSHRNVTVEAAQTP